MMPESRPGRSPRGRFLFNVVWGWAGVAVNILIGIILSPILIRRLGVEQYGLWVLLFSMIDYMRLLDFGFKAAALNRCARSRARGDWDGVSRALVTALAYFVGISSLVALLVVLLRGVLVGAMDISPAQAAVARTLIVLIAITVAIRLAESPLTGVLEAFERFDVVNSIYIGALIARGVGSLAVLLAGYGLIEMAAVVLVVQVGECLFTLIRVKQIVPGLTLHPSGSTIETLAQLSHYGRYSALISTSDLVSMNAPTIALGYMRGAADVGYFALPFRLLQYITEGIEKVAGVTSSVSAALDEVGDKQKVFALAVLTNRHCFALFMPVAVFMLAYGSALLHLWVTPDMADNGGRVLPILVISFLFAVSAQNNAGAVLIGQSRHKVYAYGTIVEAVSMIVLLVLVVPAYGIIGASWVVCGVVLAVRGVYVAAAFCWQNGFPFGHYLWSVYGPGLYTGAVMAGLALVLRSTVWPGYDWEDLILSGAVLFSVYFTLAFFTVVDAEHRGHILRWRFSGE